jgi:hypothetical protein
MAKPISLPRWAETVAGVPDTNITEPNEGKKDTGYVVGGDIPTSGGLNWWMRLVYSWIKWLDGATALATASALVVRDAAGRARFVDPVDVADADTMGARDTAIGVHAALTNPHSATAAATASRLVLRDADGGAAIAGVTAIAGAANGYGVKGTGNGTGNGVEGRAGATGGVGVYAEGPSGGGYAGYFFGPPGSCTGLRALGGTDRHGAQLDGGGSAAGASATGGFTGPGLITAAGNRTVAPVRGAIQVMPQVAPSAPSDGDVWIDSATNQLKVRINGVTKTVTLT